MQQQAMEIETQPEKNIGRMAEIYGVSLRTLRFYEDQGLLSPRRDGTQRFYDSRNEVRLQIILKAKRLGLSLREIEKVILTPIRRSTDECQFDVEQTASVLTLDMIRSKIDELETLRANNEEAISILTARLRDLQDPAGRSPSRADVAR